MTNLKKSAIIIKVMKKTMCGSFRMNCDYVLLIRSLILKNKMSPISMRHKEMIVQITTSWPTFVYDI